MTFKNLKQLVTILLKFFQFFANCFMHNIGQSEYSELHPNTSSFVAVRCSKGSLNIFLWVSI